MNAQRIPIKTETAAHALTTSIVTVVNSVTWNDFAVQMGQREMSQVNTDIQTLTKAFIQDIESNFYHDQKDDQFTFDILEMVEPLSIISVMTAAILIALS